MTISVRSTAPITGTLTDYTNGLPTLKGMTVTVRPADVIAAPFDFRDPSAVTKAVTL